MVRPLARLLALLAVLCGAGPLAGAAAAQDAEQLERRLRALVRPAGSAASVHVLDATARDRLFAQRDRGARILASNAKLFTSAAALAQLGPAATIPTSVLGDGALGPDGLFDGDLYLRGGGDPSFGSAGYAGRALGSPATVEALADQLVAVGVRTVSGGVVGDESAFDSLRGGPDSNWAASPWVRPLSALSFDENRTLGRSTPPVRAAAALDDALEARGVRVRRAPRAARTPAGAARLAAVASAPLARLVRVVNKPSSNFFAEMLLKRLPLAGGQQGTTRGGAQIAMEFAGRLGARVRLVDGSGLARGNRAAARAVVELLDEMRARPEFSAFRSSLAVAGRDGTLAKRMRRGPARGRCQAKTGTLSGVSALSGYCRARSGHTIVFSILANGVDTERMKRIEDRMAEAIVRYG